MTTRPIIAALGAALVLSGCQTPQQRGPFGTTPLLARGIYTQGALGQANRLVDRFEADRQEGGMVAVSADISDCYRTTTRPFVQTIPLRECMILDDFAVKLERLRPDWNRAAMPVRPSSRVKQGIERFHPG